MKDDFQEKWQNLGRGKLGEVTEKLMESHGISKTEKSRNLFFSSIAGTKQIPLWAHLNFSPLQETSSQGPNQTTLTKARVP